MDLDNLDEFLSAIEHVLEDALAQEHPFWQSEFLDGILPAFARKTGPCEAEILGLCVLISGQTVAPIRVCIAVARDVDRIAWLECKLGQKGNGAGGLWHLPYSHNISKDLHSLDCYSHEIDWAYCVKIGSPPASRPAV